MNLTDNHLKELENPSLTHNERFLLRCRLSSEFIHIGQYEVAREALGELWQGVGKRPEVEKLKPLTAAEVLMQCGVLSGWLGTTQHVSGAQEKAKDLVFEALRMFKAQEQYAKASEAEYELSWCYFRLGAYDDARVFLDKALNGLEDIDLKAKILIRRTIIEIWTGRYHDAWGVLEKAREFFEASGDALKGKWHSQRGLVLRRLSTTELQVDYADRAIIEYTAAIYHFEQAGHERYCGNNLNNLAFLLYKLCRYSEAHENLDRAQEIFERLSDIGSLAQVNETRARVFVAEHHYKEANRIISGVIQTFEKGSEYGRLTDALTIQGVVWARLSLHESSLHILRHAIRVAQDSGAYSNSENTREAYQRTILEFHRFVGRHLLTITEREVIAWRDTLLHNGQSNQTVASKLSTLRSLYSYLQKVYPDILKLNPADAQLVPPPRIPNALKGRALNNKEVKHLLVGPDRKTPEGARDYALMLLMLRLSLRVSEIGKIKQSSFAWKDERWTLMLKVKGGAEEIWPVPMDVKQAIEEYLRLDEKRRNTWRENRMEDQFIFQPMLNYRTGKYNRGLTRQMIGQIVRKWASFTGLKGKVTPHDLRRTAITRALNQGWTYREVQMMSKHKDPKTVMRYDYERDKLERNPVNSLNYDEL